MHLIAIAALVAAAAAFAGISAARRYGNLPAVPQGRSASRRRNFGIPPRGES